MLISFTLGNWRSFAEKTTLSMIPDKERRFDWTLARFARGQRKVLPVAVLFGANASGKSAFVSGIAFLARYVRDGVPHGRPTGAEPYRLDPAKRDEPTHFSCVLQTEGRTYEYTLELTDRKVVREDLLELGGRGRETAIFRRREGGISLRGDDARKRLVYESTQDNAPFLTSAFMHRIEFAGPVYRWFAESLQIVDRQTIDERYEAIRSDVRIQEAIGDYLRKYDTGISGIEFLPISKAIQLGMDFEKSASIRKRNGCLHLGSEVLVSRHADCGRKDVLFDFFGDESSGIHRLLDLLMILVGLDVSREEQIQRRALPDDRRLNINDRVFIVDGIERDLHPNLLFQFISDFLEMCSSDTRYQLISTTHETYLMNQMLLRRDEVWFIEKRDSQSTMYALSHFRDVRFDTSIERLYRHGAFGGIPGFVRHYIPD